MNFQRILFVQRLREGKDCKEAVALLFYLGGIELHLYEYFTFYRHIIFG